MNRLALVLSMMAVAAFAFAQPVSAALTSVVTDPEGDTFLILPIPVPAYLDIVKAEIVAKRQTFTFLMDMAAPVPAAPPLAAELGSFATSIWWLWALDTDLTTFPSNYPFPGWKVPQSGLSEFLVLVFWDRANFGGVLIDRRPTLTGGAAIVTPIKFSVSGSEVKGFVAASAIGAPATFQWAALTFVIWGESCFPLGPTSNCVNEPPDRAPDTDFGTFPS